MRALPWIGALLVAAGLCVALLRLGPRTPPEPPGGEGPAGASAAADPERPVVLAPAADPDAAGVDRTQVEGAAPRGARDEGPRLDDGVAWDPDRHARSAWERCLGEANPTRIRECMREWLGGRDLEPEELAALVCTGPPLNPTGSLLVQEAAALWPVHELPGRIRRFQGQCNDPGRVWLELADRQLAEDPAWGQALAASLSPTELFADEDLVLLRLADRLAQHGASELASIFEEAALGAYGASEEQVVFALQKTWARLPGDEARLELLREVALAPTFEGREGEVRTLLYCALDFQGEDRAPRESIDFLRELLADPRLGPAASAHFLQLDDWGRLPRNLDADDYQELLALARAIAG